MKRKPMARPRRRARGQAVQARMQGLLQTSRSSLLIVAQGLAARPAWTAAGVALIVVALVIGNSDDPEQPSVETVHASAVALPAPVPTAEEPPAPEYQPGETKAMQVGREWQLVEVEPGQSLDRIFREMSLGPGLLHSIVNLNDTTAGLARIRPGDQFAFDLDAEGELRALRAELDEQNWLFVERDEGGLVSRIESRELDHQVIEASGEITSSLFNAAKDAGLTDNMTMRLAAIFGWDIDFALDIRAGDQFAVVYEQIWRDGEFLRDGDILAARFVNQGDAFEAIRFDAGNGPDYFAPDGRPMRKAFLRAPLNFSYVTSNFNPRRFHPVTRRIRPHNGTDYGAPVGTPVWAAGDGRIIESAYNSLNGHYVSSSTATTSSPATCTCRGGRSVGAIAYARARPSAGSGLPGASPDLISTTSSSSTAFTAIPAPSTCRRPIRYQPSIWTGFATIARVYWRSCRP